MQEVVAPAVLLRASVVLVCLLPAHEHQLHQVLVVAGHYLCNDVGPAAHSLPPLAGSVLLLFLGLVFVVLDRVGSDVAHCRPVDGDVRTHDRAPEVAEGRRHELGVVIADVLLLHLAEPAEGGERHLERAEGRDEVKHEEVLVAARRKHLERREREQVDQGLDSAAPGGAGIIITPAHDQGSEVEIVGRNAVLVLRRQEVEPLLEPELLVVAREHFTKAGILPYSVEQRHYIARAQCRRRSLIACDARGRLRVAKGVEGVGEIGQALSDVGHVHHLKSIAELDDAVEGRSTYSFKQIRHIAPQCGPNAQLLKLSAEERHQVKVVTLLASVVSPGVGGDGRCGWSSRLQFGVGAVVLVGFLQALL